MAKNKTEKMQEIIDNQGNGSLLVNIENILKKITEHKEALGILGVVISVIVTALWNLGCDFGYMGYANKFDIPMMYIQKDNSSLLVQFIIISVTTFLVMLPIYKLAEYNSNKKIRHVFTIVISLSIISIPYILNWIFNAIEADNIVVTSLLSLTALLAIISILFFFLYIAVLLIFRFDNIPNNIEETTENTSNCNQNADEQQTEVEKTEITNATETQAETEKTVIANVKNVGKSLIVAIPCLALLSFLILIGVYLTGSLIADSKTNYRFLVKDFETDLYIGKEYHVILSETDTHYYLAKSVIKLDSSDNNIFIGDNKQLILEIYTDFVTVIEKPKESFIREIHFTKTEIQ